MNSSLATMAASIRGHKHWHAWIRWSFLILDIMIAMICKIIWHHGVFMDLSWLCPIGGFKSSELGSMFSREHDHVDMHLHLDCISLMRCANFCWKIHYLLLHILSIQDLTTFSNIWKQHWHLSPVKIVRWHDISLLANNSHIC